MRERILLVEPFFQRLIDSIEGGFKTKGIPLGTLYLAGQLKREGFDVHVRDMDYNPNGTTLEYVPKVKHFVDFLVQSKNEEYPIWNEYRELIHEYRPDIVGISVISTKRDIALIMAKIAKQQKVKRVIMG
jgi:anaerobic magnesium-protoporphyrin IX monomethyl ester cyclase